MVLKRAELPLGRSEPPCQLHVLDREGGKAQVFEVKGKNLSLVGWKKTEAGPRGVAVTNRWGLDEKEAPESYLADPSTGILVGETLYGPVNQPHKTRFYLSRIGGTSLACPMFSALWAITAQAAGHKLGPAFRGPGRFPG